LKWGIVDVKAWLKKLPHGVLDQWVAFDRVEPIGEDWKQTASILSMLSNLAGTIAATAGITMEVADVNDCMPLRYQRPKKALKPAIPKPEAAKTDFARFGASVGLTEVIKKHGINQPG
jgi:hypothetical protein